MAFDVQDTYLTDYDKKVYSEYLADFLPERMIDVHLHIMQKDSIKEWTQPGIASWTEKVTKPDYSAEELFDTYKRLFPGKKVTPVLMGTPVAVLCKTNGYAVECGAKYGLPVLYCTAYDTPLDEIRKALASGGFAGLKPYHNNAPEYIPADEKRIFDFLPHEHLQIADELGAVIMLHLPRPGRLRDRVNLMQLMEIDKNYRKAKVIIAHIGRAYIEDDLGDAFDTLKHSRNLLFDFSANTLDKAMVECIKAVGPERVMFGSDLPIVQMRMYRIAECGIYKNVVPRGLYGDVSGDKNMKETDETDITLFIYEELKAFRRAAEELSLSRRDIENVFYNNAKRLFNIQ